MRQIYIYIYIFIYLRIPVPNDNYFKKKSVTGFEILKIEVTKGHKKSNHSKRYSGLIHCVYVYIILSNICHLNMT